MYEQIKSIDLSEELKINELYNIFKTNSSDMNLEIYSKLQTFSTAAELFKHFMNEEIKIYYQKADNFIQQLSSIINKKNNNFVSKTDKYICDFSYILVLLNIISKLNDSLMEILKNTKNALSNIYEKYSSDLDKRKQEKFNELIDILLNKYSSSIDYNSNNKNKSSNKLYMSKSSTKENSNGSLDHNAQYLLSEAKHENKEFLLGKENINNANKNTNSNFINETPRFKNITNVSPSSNNNNNNSDEKNNDIDSNLNFTKQKSFDSVFTLSQNINNNNNNNSNGNEKENIINKSINITSINNNNKDNKDNKDNKNNKDNKDNKDNIQNNESNDLNDYITNIQKDTYFTKSSKRRQSCRFKSYKSNLTINKIDRNKSIDMKNNVNLFSSLKDNTSNFNSLEKINFNKFSSRHLFISNESKMYADLFEIIIELYKSKKISLEQKLKLKKLIICKNPQILSVYKYFDVDNEKFVKQLKKIIQ